MKKKKSGATVGDILRAVHAIAPPHLALSWDNVGLQIGRSDAPAPRVLVALEVTKEVLAECTARRASVLVTHHPIIFQPLKNMVEDRPVTQLVAEAIRRGISLIAAHTNLDSVANGTNGELADRIGMQAAGRKILQPVERETQFVKYTVFVPVSHVEKVIAAASAAGAGVFGNYSHCTFGAPGIGTFKPLEGADPFSGEIGRLAHEEEFRLETRCTKAVLPKVLAAVRAVHPYEEIAYDLYTLEPEVDASAGLGLIGSLKETMTLGTFITRIKKSLGIKSVGVVGDLKTKVRRIAMSTGASGMFVREWKDYDADVFITGEMTHHDCAEAHHRGLPVLLVGHWVSEAIVAERFASLIRERFSEGGVEGVTIMVSEKERNPLHRV